MPPEVAARLVRALDRSPGMVIDLVGRDLKRVWLSQSARWVTGADPARAPGHHTMGEIHPNDLRRLAYHFAQIQAAKRSEPGRTPVIGPVRYRWRRPDGEWIVLESYAHNLMDDPLVDGIVVESRPVPSMLDGVGLVVDLLARDAPLTEVLAACAALVPAYIGSTAVVGLVDGGPVIGAAPASAAERLAADDRWWRDVVDAGPDVVAPRAFAGFPDDLVALARQEGFRTAWVAPFVDRSSGDVIGCAVVWARIDVAFKPGADGFVRQMRRLASLVVGEERRRQELHRQAVTDPLTGLGNRSALRRRLDAADGPVTLAAIDLDHFKPVNDTYGHATGDAVLQVIGERLGDVVRGDDLVSRVGGDEFAVVFAADTSPEKAATLLERITATIEAPVMVGEGVAVSVGASVGLATAPPHTVVREADAALYQVKRSKRSPHPPR